MFIRLCFILRVLELCQVCLNVCFSHQCNLELSRIQAFSNSGKIFYYYLLNSFIFSIFFFSFQNSYYLHFVFPWPIFQIFTLMISIYVCFVLYFEIILALTVNDLPLNSFKILFQNKVKFCFKNNVTKLLDMCVHYTWISLNAVVYFHLCFHLL